MRFGVLFGLCMALVGSFGCGSDDGGECGPPAEPASARLSAQIGSTTVVYGDFTTSPNNDCPPAEGGPTSLTVEGLQREPATEGRFSIVFCLPRPDEIGAEPVSLDDVRLMELSDVNARLDAQCTLRRDYDTAPQGTLTFAGYCDAGLDEAGYAISIDATVAGIQRCTDEQGERTESPISVTLSGSADVIAVFP